MENKNIWHIEPQGGTIERAIINTLNFVVDIVYENIVKLNQKKINNLENENTELKAQLSKDNETMLDMAFELDVVKDDNAELNEGYLDLDYRVSQIEEKEVV